MSSICQTETKALQNSISADGILFSSNASHHLKAKYFFDAIDVPAYPTTSKDGVLYFIHNPDIISQLRTQISMDSTAQNDIKKMRKIIRPAFSLLRSRVCPAYARPMLSQCLANDSQMQNAFYKYGEVRDSKVLLLMPTGPKKGRANAWCQPFKCSGIKHCEYAAQHIVSNSPANDKIDLNEISYGQVSPSGSETAPEKRLQQNTEA
jgi:hypothetical protein